MAQISSLTVNDGAATPVARTFNIMDKSGVSSLFRDMSSALIRGARTFKQSISLATKSGVPNNVSMVFVYPTEASVNGQTAVVRTSSARVEFNFAADEPETERKAFIGLVKNTLANADVTDSALKIYPLAP